MSAFASNRGLPVNTGLTGYKNPRRVGFGIVDEEDDYRAAMRAAGELQNPKLMDPYAERQAIAKRAITPMQASGPVSTQEDQERMLGDGRRVSTQDDQPVMASRPPSTMARGPVSTQEDQQRILSQRPTGNRNVSTWDDQPVNASAKGAIAGGVAVPNASGAPSRELLAQRYRHLNEQFNLGTAANLRSRHVGKGDTVTDLDSIRAERDSIGRQLGSMANANDLAARSQNGDTTNYAPRIAEQVERAKFWGDDSLKIRGERETLIADRQRLADTNKRIGFTSLDNEEARLKKERQAIDNPLQQQLDEYRTKQMFEAQVAKDVAMIKKPDTQKEIEDYKARKMAEAQIDAETAKIKKPDSKQEIEEYRAKRVAEAQVDVDVERMKKTPLDTATENLNARKIDRAMTEDERSTKLSEMGVSSAEDLKSIGNDIVEKVGIAVDASLGSGAEDAMAVLENEDLPKLAEIAAVYPEWAKGVARQIRSKVALSKTGFWNGVGKFAEAVVPDWLENSFASTTGHPIIGQAKRTREKYVNIEKLLRAIEGR